MAVKKKIILIPLVELFNLFKSVAYRYTIPEVLASCIFYGGYDYSLMPHLNNGSNKMLNYPFC